LGISGSVAGMAGGTWQADLLDSSGRIPLGGASRCPLHAFVGPLLLFLSGYRASVL